MELATQTTKRKSQSGHLRSIFQLNHLSAPCASDYNFRLVVYHFPYSTRDVWILVGLSLWALLLNCSVSIPHKLRQVSRVATEKASELKTRQNHRAGSDSSIKRSYVCSQYGDSNCGVWWTFLLIFWSGSKTASLIYSLASVTVASTGSCSRISNLWSL